MFRRNNAHQDYPEVTGCVPMDAFTKGIDIEHQVKYELQRKKDAKVEKRRQKALDHLLVMVVEGDHLEASYYSEAYKNIRGY